MSIKSDKASALNFLEWWFGANPAPNFIGISYQRDLDNAALDDAPQIDDGDEDDEGRPRKGKREVQQFTYSAPEKAIKSQWDAEAERNHIYFCTTPLLRQNKQLQAANAAGVPGLWVDIDALRDLDIDGDAFYVELRDQEEFSCLSRSSVQGIQGFFRLDKLFSLTDDGADSDTDKKTKNRVFKEEIKPFLLNIAYYFGGDPKVVSPARLMRLPGTVNPKRDNYLCKAQYFDKAWTMAELRKRFKTDENLVPKVVFYAIAEAMSKVYGPGSHHEPSMHLFGTCRMLGIDEGSCERLAGDLHRFFKDMADDPTPSVATTYNRSAEEGIVTLRNDFEEISEEVEKAVKFWVQLKVKYCKAIGLRWKPEVEGNPLADAGDQDGIFHVKPDGTYFTNKNDVPEMFANFSLRILHKVMKVDGSEVAIAEMTFKNRRYVFEWAGEKDSSFAQFKKIKQLPPGATVLVETMWKSYIPWLYEQPVDKYLQEMPYYGVLDAKDKRPTLLLPNRPHEDYVWAQTEHDTASHAKAFREISKRDAVDYLTKFAKFYPYYHERKFIWCSLGWFAACPFSAFAYAREVDKGFPVLLISGLRESGKSSLITNVLANHMGCVASQTYLGSTLASRRAQLASNNLVPLIVDEFRDVDEVKTTQFTDLIRNLWDQNERRAKTKDGGAAIDRLIGTLCVIGEHSYEDGATLDRTVSIHISRDFIEAALEMSTAEQEQLAEARRWLESTDRAGMLSALLIQWMQDHYEELPDLLEKANRIIRKTLKSRQLRNSVGFAVVVFGLLVMQRLYKTYDLDFPLDRDTMLAAIGEADEAVSANSAYGTANLKMLFAVTDNVIIGELRKSMPMEHWVYEFDPVDDDIIYFDMGRWHDCIHKQVRGSASATLSNKTAFFDLLRVSINNEDSPILDFPENNPVITKGCVKIDLKRVREQFGINVQQWKTDCRDYDA